MGSRLRVVMDQARHIVDADEAAASQELLAALVSTAPEGCDIEAIVPAGAELKVSGVASVRVLPLARRELAVSWQLGVVPGVGGGLIHSSSLMAPLVRHDRLHDYDQTTVTLWSLRAWEKPDSLSRADVAHQRRMLRRAVKHADAIVVPSHSLAERLTEIAKVGERVRVIAGASPGVFTDPAPNEPRPTAMPLSAPYVVVAGDLGSLEVAFRAVAATGHDAVVLDADVVSVPSMVHLASVAGLDRSQVHIPPTLSAVDRVEVLAGGAAFLATISIAEWPWRVLEAMSLGIPVVAVDSGIHRDVIADAGLVVPPAELGGALEEAVGNGAARMRVLSADRSRAFSWMGAAERVWALHADL